MTAQEALAEANSAIHELRYLGPTLSPMFRDTGNSITRPGEPIMVARQQDGSWRATLFSHGRRIADIYGDTPEQTIFRAYMVLSSYTMLAFVKQYEWSSKAFDSPACPVCYGYKHVGHTSDCELGNFFSALNSLADVDPEAQAILMELDG